MEFETLGLEKGLIDAVSRIGFKTPTPIQEKVIPEIIGGTRDLVGLAQTGTGKTAAFGLPLLQQVDGSRNHVQGLVLSPTRELCLQIAADLKSYAVNLPGIKITEVYGGASISNQIRAIHRGVSIIVATPGRLLDLINRKKVDLSRLNYLVLDEADEMLNMGFKEDLDAILSRTPDHKHTWLFSATMPSDVARIASQYMDDPVEITVGKKNGGASNIEHANVVIREKDRYKALKRMIDYHPDIYGLVFCRTRSETQEIAEKLIRDGYNAEALHGDMSQAARDTVMSRFRQRNLQVLVATDVAARGIDVKDITHVIHYKLPDDMDSYTHRSGRTARAGKSGLSIVLMNVRENRKLMELERHAGIQFTRKKIPAGHAICEKQLFAMVGKLVSVDVDETEIGRLLAPVYDTLSGLSREELIKRFVTLEFNRFFNYYKDAGDINVEMKKPSSKKKFSKKDTPNTLSDSRRFFANIGHLDHLNKGALVRLICDRSGIASRKIGHIEIKREFSFFEVDASVAERVRNALKHVALDGRKLAIDYAIPKGNWDKKSAPPYKFKPGKKKAGKKRPKSV